MPSSSPYTSHYPVVALKKLALLAVLPGALLIASCSDVTNLCPPGQEMNDEETECVPKEVCEGGILVDGECECPENQILVGDACTDPCPAGEVRVDDRCVPGLCDGVDCTSDNDCVGDGTCDPTTGDCERGALKGAGSVCGQDGGTVCDGAGSCVECTQDGDQCADDNNCTSDVCSDGVCTNPSSDGNKCDLSSIDDGVCVAGECEEPSGLCAGVSCDDGNQCTDDGVCNPATGECDSRKNEPRGVTTCNQDGGSYCDGDGSCVECTQGGVQCEDGNQCTTDVCSSGVCIHHNSGGSCDLRSVDDGVCVAKKCEEVPEVCEDISCDDGNECTDNECREAGGSYVCVNEPLTDGACTVGGEPGTCDSAGQCEGLCVGVFCDDGNQCTDDGVCNPATGRCDSRKHEPRGEPICNQDGGSYCDGNGNCDECTEPSHCPQPTNSCLDAVCNAGVCGFEDAIRECTYNGIPGAGECSAGACVDGGRCEDVVCTANASCTDLSCNPANGQCDIETAAEDGAWCSGGACLDGVCGTVFPCTEEGILAAIAHGGGPLTFDCSGRTIVPTTATLVIDGDVILDGENKLVVHGSNAHRVFIVRAGSDAELRRLEVTGGKLTQATSYGAGIHNSGTLTIRESKVTGNSTAGGGGGIHNKGKLALFDSSEISGNHAEKEGGGLYNQSGAEARLDSSSLDDNEASQGGGAYNKGILKLLSADVTRNTAEELGGGLRNYGGDLKLELSTVSQNFAKSNGGGILTGGGGTLLLLTSTVDGNTAQRHGGGVYTIGKTDILRSTISNNHAVTLQGGGVRNFEGTLRIENSTIYGNKAGTEGGGLHNVGPGSATLVFNTFWVNKAGNAATDIRNTGSMQLLNNLIGGTCNGNPAGGNSFYNVFSKQSCFNLTSNTPGNTNTTTGPTPIEPPGLLRGNDGPTLTVLPNDVTPPIDWVFGGGLYCNALNAVDQRGFKRKRDGKCDAGAVERE